MKPTHPHRARAKTIPAGALEARRLKVIDEVACERTPVVITTRGRPVATLVPAEEQERDLCGHMAGTIEILGDIASPFAAEREAQH